MDKQNTFHSRRAQTTMDYMILTGVVLAVIVPLIYLSTERLSGVGISQVTEAVQALKAGVLEIDNLGYGAGKRVVVQIPKGIEKQSVGNGEFYYTFNGQIVSAQVPSNLTGALPTTEGRHFINLFNDGKQIYFYQCGNGQLEAFEQCDGKAGSCGSPLGCIDPSSPTAACFCYCSSDTDCATLTTIGDCVEDPQTKINYCAPCIDDAACKPGNICQMGKCVPDICASVPGGVRCGSFLNPICCKAGEICLNNQCAVPCSTTNPCPNGQFCNNGQCQNIVCGDGRIDLPETCDPPGLQSTCEVGEICVGCTSCQSSSVNCGNLQLDPGEECDFDALGNQLGSCLSTEYCDSQTCTCGSFQQYCPLGTICPGNYVCDQANICSPCSTTNPCPKGYICSVAGTCQFPCSAANPCPSGYSCLADGTCQLPPGPGQCGNAQLETGEECEYIIGNAGQFTITSTCASSTKPVCNTQDCLCYQSPLTGFCGDGTLQSGIGEECDEGTGNGGSSLTCLGLGLGPVCGLDCQCARSGSYCGDGPPPDITAGEKCELPGSIGPNNGCPSGTLCGTDCSCSAPQCGNGRVEPGEQCDTRAFPGCLIGSPLTPFVSYCSSSCTCIYVDPPPASQPPGGNPPGGGNGPGNGNPSGPGNPASSSGGGSGGPLTCQEDDPKNPGQKKPTCNQASDCGDPTQYFCRYNCCFNKPSGGGGTGTGSPLE